MKNQIESKKAKDERDAVKRNMEKATETEPSEFRDEANEQKRVEIGKDLTKDSIQGIDPKT